MTPSAGHLMSEAVRAAYRHHRDDETLPPLVRCDARGRPVGRLRGNDAVIFYNIRGEREVELTRSLTEPGFSAFPVAPDLRLEFATMIEYRPGLCPRILFPPTQVVRDTLSDVVSRHGLRQAKITEAEKAVHVGYFLNGKKNDILPGEERIILPTRKDVALFDEAPEMSLREITEAVLARIQDPSLRFVFVNFPNVDVLGHIENEQAILRAVEAVDRHLGTVAHAALAAGFAVIVTADHGTVEKWRYPDGAIDTGHTDSPVPFVLACPGSRIGLREGGELTDVAPTVLSLLGLPIPEVMTGRSLLAPGARLSNNEAPRVLLLLLDGWGDAPAGAGNLISRAATPNLDRLRASFPGTILRAAGETVGLPPNTVGNSEAGHLHIGAGRRIYADRVRIDRALANGSFFQNETARRLFREARSRGAAVHLMGIVSFFSSHGSLPHLFALMDLARQLEVPDLCIHAMLGRRGEQPEAGAHYIRRIEDKLAEINLGRVVSVIGRFWSLDREEHWDRIGKTYRMLVYGEGTPVREGRMP